MTWHQGGMKNCSTCGGAVFPPGVVVQYGGQICRCDQSRQNPTHAWPLDRSTEKLIDILERIERKLDRLAAK